ncbi:MAG: hypothetical protein MUC51_18880 [Anaerolineae bacterium]|jgi:hypothetical protein|nr:hypothetical protein [Anaerolineae bacterium]
MPLHMVYCFPRTNDAQRFLDAKVSLVTNIVLTVLAGLAMVGVTAVYFWVRG